MAKKYLTFSKADRAQLLQLDHSSPVLAGDLISKRSAHMLVDEGFAFLDDEQKYCINEHGRIVASFIEEEPA